ncbi:MAG TPA: VOC family protein [Edaphobacter sp.]|jgi:catechol 2,3-dioxygenase-like lactoylglutathione lyase family enzyme|nr:VOC family protein [Edaphobacter sp.]
MNVWYSRPVFFVESVERSIAFYTEKLGFAEASRYEEEGKILVGQVNREDCEILLNCQQPEKTGHGRIFISIEIGVLQALRAEFEGRGAPIRDGWWGYDTMIIEDPDGNQLFFPYPKDAKEESDPVGGS